MVELVHRAKVEYCKYRDIAWSMEYHARMGNKPATGS